MALASGTRLGPYEITAPLGAGGMGEVYRARDTKLNRNVAIKVLPDAVADDPERLARFHREAQVLASLNHPNIAHIYGIEDSGSTHALVMELVDGPTLADRIAQGPVPLNEALPIAKQIAEALETAHEQGIIHRDLKPANIKVRHDGTVKVLDFGLAKMLEAPSSGLQASATVTASPTITTPAATMAGVILGTAAYMSPEQAKGRPADKRSDVWAFGCVLYEMLTGKRAFEGEDVSDTLAFVITKEPDWSVLPKTSPSIHRLVRRCLVKNRVSRLPDIGSARLDIDDARTEADAPAGSSSIVHPSGAIARRTVTLIAVALVGSAISAVAVWMAMRGQPTRLPVARVMIGVGPAERLLSGLPLDASVGRGRPSRTALALSPDGRALVFSAEHEGRVQLYLRRLDQLDATVIAGTEGASNPFFSPDGQSIGFYANGALKKLPLNGGPVVELCKVGLIYGASWGRTDRIVFAHRTGGLWAVSAAGGQPTTVTKLQAESGEVSHRLPQFLPDGQTVLFTVTKSGFPSWDDDTLVAVQSLASGQRQNLIDGGADARFVATGHLVYVRRGTLMAVPFDVRQLRLTGSPEGIVGDLMQAANIQPDQIDTGAGQFAVSESGSLVYVSGGVFPQDRWTLAWVDRLGRSEPVNVPAGAYLAPRLSPDGKRIAFNSTTGDWDLWTNHVARGIVARLPMEGVQSVPIWTPDGSGLVFSSQLKGTVGLFRVSSDGRGLPDQLIVKPTTSGLIYANSWTPDGTALAITYQRGISLFPRDGKAEPRRLLASGSQAEFSPDGRWLAYAEGSSEEGRIYVQPYPALNHREQVSIGNGTSPSWRQDGRELYYVENVSREGTLKVRVMAVLITPTPTFSAGTPRMLFEGPFRIDGPFRGYDVTPDGQRFLMVQGVQQPPARVSQMVLVQNWNQELKRLGPTK